MKSNSFYSEQVIHGQYYPHIDGIRALAVIPVVLFHIFAALCPGGFTGVDVFFVISGYLITGGILRDLAQGQFSIRNFYYRRIRRIMPAYFVLICGVMLAGCVLYYANPFILLSDAVVSGTLFLANFQFWSLGGNYFAPKMSSQALLNLWSLSVEEQFYFFIPIFCAAIWKFRRGLVFTALALLAAFSLFGAIYAVMNGKQNHAFYFLHFRAWELLAGSLLAAFPAVTTQESAMSLLNTNANSITDHRATESSRIYDRTSTVFAAVGLCMVLTIYAVISPKTQFPGAVVLPTVIGTALLIRYGKSGWISRLLSWGPFVSIGKMSYSLYLWHWPVIVFWKYIAYNQLYVHDYIGMFMLSLLLGYLSWRFVELPVRTSPSWTMSRSFVSAAAGTVLLVILGTTCAYYKGWPTILHPEANKVANMPLPRVPFIEEAVRFVIRRAGFIAGKDFAFIEKHVQIMKEQRSVYCAHGEDGGFSIGVSGQPKVFLLGDSHAGSVRYGLDMLLREKDIAGYAVNYSAKKAFDLGVPESKAALNKLAKLPEVSHVVLVQFWTPDLQFKGDQLEAFSRYIHSMGKKLFIAADIPRYEYAFHDIEARVRMLSPRQPGFVKESRQQSAVEYNRQQGATNRKLEEICRKTGAVFIPLHLAMKDGDFYTMFDENNGNPVLLYRDEHHLSEAGSLCAAKFIISYLFPGAVSRN